jgi:hypothetical protein
LIWSSLRNYLPPRRKSSNKSKRKPRQQHKPKPLAQLINQNQRNRNKVNKKSKKMSPQNTLMLHQRFLVQRERKRKIRRQRVDSLDPCQQ